MILQNIDDLTTLAKLGALGGQAADVIYGSGVNTDLFAPRPPETGRPVTLVFAGRFLRSKGLADFVDAASRLRGSNFRFIAAGAPDPGNPDSITPAQVDAWRSLGVVEFPGQRSDMPKLLQAADVAVFPSYYGEGVPRFLLEAAACGLPLIAADAPGARSVVQANTTGILVPSRDPARLAAAISTLAADPGLRARMGSNARALVLRGFSESSVFEQTLRVYAKAKGAAFREALPGAIGPSA